MPDIHGLGIDFNSAHFSLGGAGNVLSVIGSGIAPSIPHNSLSGLQGGSAGQYYHLTSAQYSALHAAVTVSDTASVDLTLVGQALTATVLPAGVDHNSLNNLAVGDVHTHYVLAAGRAGGQTVNGDTASGGDIRFNSTAHATKGKIYLGANAYYDEANDAMTLPLATSTSNRSSLNFGLGGHLLSMTSAAMASFSGGCHYNSVTGWIAEDTGATIFQFYALAKGDFYLTTNTGLTIGNAFAPSLRFYISNTGNIGIGGTSAPSYLFSLSGQAARTIGMERHTTAASAGNNLTINAGGCKAAGSNLAGGNLLLYPGVSTGSGVGNVLIYAYPGTAAATADNTAALIATFSAAGITIPGGKDIILDTSTGTKIGASDTALLSFYNATPTVRQNHIVDADGTLADATTKINAILVALETIGILKAA